MSAAVASGGSRKRSIGHLNPLRLRWDVLVQVEQVGRVVTVLQRPQPVELLRSISGSHPLLPLGGEEVDVGATGQRGLDLGVETLRPVDVVSRPVGSWVAAIVLSTNGAWRSP
jgi:hypothetical protein